MTPPADVLVDLVITPAGGVAAVYRSPGAKDALGMTAEAFPELLPAGLRAAVESPKDWLGELAAAGRPFRATAFPSGGGLTLLLADRTAEVAADRRLAAQLANTPLAVVEWDRDFRVCRWSGQAEAVFGWPAAAVLGRHPSEWPFVHPADADRVAAVIDRLHTHTEPRNVVRNRNYRADARVAHCEWHNSVIPDAAGGVESILSLVLDRTAEVEAAAAVARGEDRLRLALESAGMIGWEHDPKTGTTTYSTAPERFYGRPAADAGHVHPDDRTQALAALRASAAAGIPLNIEFRGAEPAADGGDRWFVSRGRPEPAGAGWLLLVGVTAEVTIRKRAEAERTALDQVVREAARRESIGLLAGGVAHDFNNILTVILGNTGLAKAILPPGHDARTRLETVEVACQRASDLCRQMAAYAGVGRLVVRDVDCNRVIADARPALRAAVPPHATLTVAPAAAVPAVAADPTQLRQLLLNLVVNAAEALPESGGEVRIETRAVDRPGGAGFSPPPGAGAGVVVAVADTGAGMTDAVRGRAFEPFYTTKFTGRGLGLAAVQGIARSHGGSIRVTSEVGRGTTVEVFFPASHGPAAAPATRSGVTPPPARRRGVALVVDDEANIRELAASLLEEAGYEVDTAAAGDAGLALIRADPTRYALAVFDLTMPGMSGDELAAAAHALRPDLPIVLMTGYASKQLESRMLGRGVSAVLAKPFRVEELLAVADRAVG